jgi:hypothetical protein
MLIGILTKQEIALLSTSRYKKIQFHTSFNNFILKDSFCGKIKLLLDRLGFSHVWDNQGTFHKDRFLLAVEEK